MPAVEIHRVVANSAEAVIVVQFANYRHLDRAGFYAVVHGPLTGWQPTVVASEDLRPGDRWEFRTSGLWAEQVREQPTASEEHWSYGLEAFAIRLDNPVELLGRGYGDRCALGWELDVFVPLEPAQAQPKHGRSAGILLYEDLELDAAGPTTRWEWSFEPDELSELAGSDLFRTVVDPQGDGHDQRRQPDVLPPTVVVPTLLGEWTVAIADRPASGSRPST